MNFNNHEEVLLNAMYKNYKTQLENGKAPDKAQHIDTDEVFSPLIEKWGYSEVIEICEILESKVLIDFKRADNTVYWAHLTDNAVKLMRENGVF